MTRKVGKAGPWKLEELIPADDDGNGEIVQLVYRGNEDAAIVIERDDLSQLLGALMVYLDVQSIEAVDRES